MGFKKDTLQQIIPFILQLPFIEELLQTDVIKTYLSKIFDTLNDMFLKVKLHLFSFIDKMDIYTCIPKQRKTNHLL